VIVLSPRNAAKQWCRCKPVARAADRKGRKPTALQPRRRTCQKTR